MARPVERGDENVEIGRVEKDGDSTSISIPDLDIVKRTSSITRKLVGDSPLPASCCIFRVPSPIRRHKPEAYTPDIISIGPFHRKLQCVHQQFQLMENVKGWYLQCLLKSYPNITLGSLIEAITNLNTRARQCYSEKFDDIGDVEFLEMMILDGCFLLELFRKMLRWREARKLPQDEDDPIVNLDYMDQYLYHDLLLLENQLPWFVLESLYDLTINTAGPSVGGYSLSQLVLHFFKLKVTDESCLSSGGEVFHILDLIRRALVASFKIELDNKQSGPNKKEQHGKLRWRCCCKDEPTTQEDSESSIFRSSCLISLQRIPNATTLAEAGVKFKKSKVISFQNGNFKIPFLPIEENTGPLFRNLIAYEQCHHKREQEITLYAILMDSLIDTSKDIDLLCEKDILVNWLSSEDATKFFNDLYLDTSVEISKSYETICKKVNEHHRNRCHRHVAKFCRDHFSTPWTIISFLAAIFLLGLTIVQTIFTVLQFL